MGVGRLGCTIAGGRMIPLCGRNDAGRMTRLAGYLLPLQDVEPEPEPVVVAVEPVPHTSSDAAQASA
eukprot:COSAG01_NODE_48638_length_379_cov_0.921429_1_plen_66_part_10